MAKMVVVTGGVVSSLGKGIAAASLAMLRDDDGQAVRCPAMDDDGA